MNLAARAECTAVAYGIHLSLRAEPHPDCPACSGNPGGLWYDPADNADLWVEGRVQHCSHCEPKYREDIRCCECDAEPCDANPIFFWGPLYDATCGDVGHICLACAFGFEYDADRTPGISHATAAEWVAFMEEF